MYESRALLFNRVTNKLQTSMNVPYESLGVDIFKLGAVTQSFQIQTLSGNAVVLSTLQTTSL